MLLEGSVFSGSCILERVSFVIFGAKSVCDVKVVRFLEKKAYWNNLGGSP